MKEKKEEKKEIKKKRDIKDLTLEELEREMESLSEPAYRPRQVFHWLYKKGASGFEEFTDLPQSLRQKLGELFFIGNIELADHLQSRDRTEKFLFRLNDGNSIESVLIPSGKRKTICLSTQVGCKFRCAFCASGLPGFKRNLSPSEMTNQVLFLEHHLGHHLTNFVFMGMGEPLDNYENLRKALLIMNSPQGMGIAARRITVSTCGLVPGIRSFKEIPLEVNLSLSLHAVTDRLRDEIMPINRKYPLEKLIEACEDYLRSGGRKMTLEYALIAGVNDSLNDAEGLAAIARRLRAKINLIRYSFVPQFSYSAPAKKKIRQFIRWLEEKRVGVTLRESKGQDIQAACGQLAGGKKSQLFQIHRKKSGPGHFLRHGRHRRESPPQPRSGNGQPRCQNSRWGRHGKALLPPDGEKRCYRFFRRGRRTCYGGHEPWRCWPGCRESSFPDHLF